MRARSSPALILGVHLIPLSALSAVFAWLGGSPMLVAFFAIVLLHALGDFPVHAINADRHFLPPSQYRFQSPLPYWDERFHGKKVALVEAVVALVSSIVIFCCGARPVAVAMMVLINLDHAFICRWNSLLARTSA